MTIEAFPGPAEATSPEEIGVIKHVLLEQFVQVESQLPLILVYDQSKDHSQDYLGRKPILPVTLIGEVYDDRPIDLEGKVIVPPESIIEGVARSFDIPTSKITGGGREQQLRLPRKVAMFLVRDMTKLSSIEIGKLFGRRDHTTVLNYVSQIQKALNNPEQQPLAAKVTKIKAALENPDRPLSDSKSGHDGAQSSPGLIFLSAWGLVACPWIDIGERYKYLGGQKESALDWRRARQSDDYYRKYSNDALKLMRSLASSQS